jgi:predicted neuraminidase
MSPMPNRYIWIVAALLFPTALVISGKSDMPSFRSELIFEPDSLAAYPSCHASTIVELPDGELLAAWFAGSREGANDVTELGSRLAPGARVWSKPQIIVDTPGKPDGNPVLHLDRKGRVWIFYVTKENDRRPQWAQCPLKCRVSTDGGRTFGPERMLHQELGWMDRNKPIYLANGYLLLPIYDERDWTSLMFISPDDGATWFPSQRNVGTGGNIQPTVVQLSDGSLLALMRTGSNHHRLWKSVSHDDGRTWTPPEETELPNPNSACDLVRLSNGHLVLAFNDSTMGRTPLTVALSTDEGRSWPRRRNLETARGEYFYPAIIRTRDGMIHVTYTYQRRSIKHAEFNEAWLMEPERARGSQGL